MRKINAVTLTYIVCLPLYLSQRLIPPGYQDLTNKLLRNINEKLAEELALVSDKLERLEKVMGIAEDDEDDDGEEEVEEEIVGEEVIKKADASLVMAAATGSGDDTGVMAETGSDSSSASSDGSVDVRTKKKKTRRKKKKPLTLADKVKALLR